MGRTPAMNIVRAKILTWGQLKSALAAADPYAKAVLNPMVGRARSLEILAAAIANKPDDQVPEPWTRDHYKNRDVPSRDFLTACNVLREAF